MGKVDIAIGFFVQVKICGMKTIQTEYFIEFCMKFIETDDLNIIMHNV